MRIRSPRSVTLFSGSGGSIRPSVSKREPGRSEAELAWAIEKYFRDNGASELAFPSIVTVDQNAALPHAIPGETKVLSIAIYEAVQAGQDGKANALVILTSVVCIVILLLAARLVGGRRRELRDVA